MYLHRDPGPERTMRRMVVLALALLAACGPDRSRAPEGDRTAAGHVGAGDGTTLTGAGATFPNPIYSRWFDAYARQTGVRINYQSIGSGGGIRQYTAGTVDFGASDGPMTDEQIAAVHGDVLHIPTVLGAVVLTYNLPALGGTHLRLDGPTIADIFLGRLTRWNDSRIATLNPGVKLPATEILVAHRSDGSGTTYIFTDFLSKVSPEWKRQVGSATSVRWPVGLGGKGNEGVTQAVKQTDGAVGYVELIYAVSNHLACADVRNAAGSFVTPSLASVTAAAAAAHLTDDTDFRVSITDPPGTDAYPIASFTWLLVHRQPRDSAKASALHGFLVWMLTPQAQSVAKELQYAPLPDDVVKLVRSRLATTGG